MFLEIYSKMSYLHISFTEDELLEKKRTPVASNISR